MRGERCKYKHPAVCQNVKDFGLCHSRECDLTHQLVCRNFWITGSCARSDYCGFIHPKIIQQRVQMDNRRRNVRNKGHNQNRRDHQQKQSRTGYRDRNNKENSFNYQNYQGNMSQETQNTNFLNQQPGANIEWMLEGLMRRMERLERDQMNPWSRKQ